MSNNCIVYVQDMLSLGCQCSRRTVGNGRPTGDNKVKMCYLKRITERGEFKKAEFEIAVLDPRFN